MVLVSKLRITLDKKIDSLSLEEQKILLKQLEHPRMNRANYNHDFGSKHVKIGVIGDTHIGHKMFDEEFFMKAVSYFNKEKVSAVYHVGDILEGMSGREGHIYELSKIGFQSQIKYASELFNEFKVPVFGITGNHDQWYLKKNNAGVDVGSELEKSVKKFTYLGMNEADVFLNGKIKMKLFHPNDGSAYATCFDDKTEILTEDGWKLFKDLSNERVATLNLNKDEFEWQTPTEVTDKEYDGKLLHFKARTFDLLVTPNHRMLVRKYPNNLLQSRVKNFIMPKKSHRKINFDWVVKEAKELKNCKRQEWQMKRTCSNWQGKLIEEIDIPFRKSKNNVKVHHFGKQHIDDVAELIAWYVTEGHIRKSKLQIAQYKKINPENFASIVDLFRRMGVEPKQSRDRDITFGSMELCEWLLSECGSGSKYKHLPKWLKNQPRDVLQIVFDTMIAGDGWVSGDGFGYRSISKQLLSDFEEIAIKLGYAVTENGDSVSISKVQVMPTINFKPTEIDYRGRIYCVSVPNSYIMVRRNGRAVWSGNSYKLQKLMESFGGGEKPHLLFEGHYHKALYMFNRNIHGFESGTLMGQSEFMRLKKIPAHKGFWCVDLWIGDKSIERLKPEFLAKYD